MSRIGPSPFLEVMEEKRSNTPNKKLDKVTQKTDEIAKKKLKNFIAETVKLKDKKSTYYKWIGSCSPLNVLLCIGMSSGARISDFLEAGLDFNFVDKSGCCFASYFLLKKETFFDLSNGVDEIERLRSQFPPVSLTEEYYVADFEELCTNSKGTLNSQYKNQTSLDIALKNGYEEEAEILKLYGAKLSEDYEII